MPDAPQNPLASPDPWNMVAPAYAAEILPLFELFARDALALAALPPHPHIVDVAAGPGTLALLAAKRGAKVSAIDFSEQMLAQFKGRIPPELLPSIDLRHGDGQHLPFVAQSFDAAFSMFGLIMFPDRIAGFRELHRVLKPGRRAVVSSWLPFEGPYAILMDAVRAHVPGLPFGQGQAPLGTPDDYHREMKEAGFSSVTVETFSHPRISAPPKNSGPTCNAPTSRSSCCAKKSANPNGPASPPPSSKNSKKNSAPAKSPSRPGRFWAAA